MPEYTPLYTPGHPLCYFSDRTVDSTPHPTPIHLCVMLAHALLQHVCMVVDDKSNAYVAHVYAIEA
jgi:hypothetical protein